MDIEDQFEGALKSANPPKSLQDLVKRLLEEGYKRDEINHEITRMHLCLMAEGRDAVDDLILEVGDALDGWCHPDVKL